MQPAKPALQQQHDLFRLHFDQMLDHQHSLFQLAQQIDWPVFEKEFGALYASGVGRPGLPIRLLVGLHYLKHLFNVSDETVVATWVENPYWQYFCGEQYFRHELPCDPTTLVKWRQRVGASGLEKLLAETLAVARRGGLLTDAELENVNVDTTVQEKAVAFPTDARLCHKARRTLVREAKRLDIPLRQSYERLGPQALRNQGRYSAAGQGRRAQRETRRLRGYLGRVVRDLQRRVDALEMDGLEKDGVEKKELKRLKELLERARRIQTQKTKDSGKVYSMHAPEVECINRGKVHRKYEFGCKVRVVTTSRRNWVTAIDAEHGKPYDGATLKPALEQMNRVAGAMPERVFADKGFRGTKYHPEGVEVILTGRRGLSKPLKALLKRRNAIEPVIGHLKAEHGLNRNYLKGEQGDRMNAILSGCAFNLRKLLQAFLRLLNLQHLQAFVETCIYQNESPRRVSA